jgi:hypothetical protein
MDDPMRFLLNGGSGPTGSRYDIWEYDLSRPRFPNAMNQCMRYHVKRHVGSFRTLKAAEQALARAQAEL